MKKIVLLLLCLFGVVLSGCDSDIEKKRYEEEERMKQESIDFATPKPTKPWTTEGIAKAKAKASSNSSINK